MINRRIIASGLSIVSALAVMGGATFAFFSDTGTSTGNVFATGTMDLKLTDGDEVIADSVAATFGGTMVPGQCTGVQNLKLRNSGTSGANHAEVAVSNLVNDAGNDANPDMDSFLRIQVLNYDGVDVSSQIADTNGNTFLDLADWAALAGGLDNLALANLNADHDLDVNVCLDGSAPNPIQGDTVTSTVTVTLNQDASQ